MVRHLFRENGSYVALATSPRWKKIRFDEMRSDVRRYLFSAFAYADVNEVLHVLLEVHAGDGGSVGLASVRCVVGHVESDVHRSFQTELNHPGSATQLQFS